MSQETNKTLVELDAVLDIVSKHCSDGSGSDNNSARELLDKIKTLPTTNEHSPIQGKWIEDVGYYGDVVRCSQCGVVLVHAFPYCPLCGAKMSNAKTVTNEQIPDIVITHPAKRYVVDINNFKGKPVDVFVEGEDAVHEKSEEEYTEAGYLVLGELQYQCYFEDFCKTLCDHWEEITVQEFVEKYFEEPAGTRKGLGFFAKERIFENLAEYYIRIGGSCFSSIQDTRTKEVDILKSLVRWMLQGNH